MSKVVVARAVVLFASTLWLVFLVAVGAEDAFAAVPADRSYTEVRGDSPSAPAGLPSGGDPHLWAYVTITGTFDHWCLDADCSATVTAPGVGRWVDFNAPPVYIDFISTPTGGYLGTDTWSSLDALDAAYPPPSPSPTPTPTTTVTATTTATATEVPTAVTATLDSTQYGVLSLFLGANLLIAVATFFIRHGSKGVRPRG